MFQKGNKSFLIPVWNSGKPAPKRNTNARKPSESTLRLITKQMYVNTENSIVYPDKIAELRKSFNT